MAIYQDTVYSLALAVTAAGVAVDITGWTFSASFRQKVTDTAALVTLTSANGGFTITSAVAGTLTMQFTAAQTLLLPVGHVVFDIMRTDVSDQQRLCGGRARVKQAVTRL